MTDVIVALPLADEQLLIAEAARHGHRVVARCASAEEVIAQFSAAPDRPELLIVASAAPYLTEELVSVCDNTGVRVIVVAASESERRYAASLGVIDAIDAPFEWPVLRSARLIGAPPVAAVEEDTQVRFVRPTLSPAPITTQPLTTQPLTTQPLTTPPVTRPTPPRRGTIIAVWGPPGAPGRTSLAIALAAELSATGAAVALADADTHAAAVAPALGLLDEAPGFAAACRLVSGGALDSRQFERIAQGTRTGSGELRVLTGIGRPSRWPELTAERIAGVLSAARDWVDATVVDVAASFEQDEELMSDLHAPRRNAATIEVLRSADRVIAVGAADPVGLARFLRAHAELIEVVDPNRVTTVINKVRSGAIGLDAAAQVRQTLARFGGITDPVLVPWDLSAFDAALLSGRPLPDAAPRSAARVAIRELASQLRVA